MPKEQTFRSPSYYETEIDRSQPVQVSPTGVPAAVVSTSRKGPAFVPITFANYDQFKQTFGDLDHRKFGPYAVNEFLKHRSSLTFLRVLGAGSVSGSSDVLQTQTTGRVVNAGVKFVGSEATHDSQGRHNGAVQFLVGNHTFQANEAFGLPMFTDNSSFGASTGNIVRGIVLLASGARMMVLDGDESAVGAISSTGPDDGASIVDSNFKLIISSTLGNEFGNTDGNVGVKIFTASYNPSNTNYFAKILNRNPDRFAQEQHYLLTDFAVDNEIAAATTAGVLSGSHLTSENSGESTTTFRDAYGAFDTRYKAPTSPMFISQPFGTKEYDLFHFEALDDGEFANKLYKIAISNVKASNDDANQFGTFTVEIRDWNDTDVNPNVLERYPLCNLDPNSENYVGRLIGDRKVFFNFNATVSSERRLISTGKYPNVSNRVRIVMNSQVEEGKIPETTLPFGFRGMELLKTNDVATDVAQENARIAGILNGSAFEGLSGSILPPIPFRFKCTKGETATSGFPGNPGNTEIATSQFYWGVKFERNNSPLNPNVSSEKNELLASYTKFLGIKKLDVLVTGSGADDLNNNKFTLAKVALSNTSISHLTASVNTHMKEAAYLRDATVNNSNYTVDDGVLSSPRLTLASVLASGTPTQFNKFIPFNKFVTFMHGGYDGVNFLDRDASRLNDKASSFDTGGGANSTYISPGLLINAAGTGQANSTVSSYKEAVNIMTEPQSVNNNILLVPGIKEPFLTDHTALKVKNYGLAYYVMDIPSYDEASTRLFDDSTVKPDVEETTAQFSTRAIDNNYVGVYYPDVKIDDTVNNKRVKVPASVAALGALAFNDRVAYPWFAPAGFNRAALDFVKNAEVRLSAPDRDILQEARINPIATFPRQGFVIFGQKTLQFDKSALDRVNVRRMLLDVKRVVIDIAKNLVWEQNTATVRNLFVSGASQRLSLIQSQQGVEKFRVIMNETNNTQEDIDLNRINGKIVVVPTRTAEFISIGFVITNSGVDFTS